MGADVLHTDMTRALETRLRRLEAKHRPEGRTFFLAWGEDEEAAAQRVSLARAAGEVGSGDVVVMAKWTGLDFHGRPLRMPMPASRWVGKIGPFSAELDALLGEIRRVTNGADNRDGEDADPDPRAAAYLTSLSDAQLVAMALGVELR